MLFTNKICGSYNRTLNLRFVGAYKSILNFDRCIKEIIEICENRNIYQERNISITRALQFYVNNKTHDIELINNSDLKEIKDKYLNYLNCNHIPNNDWNYSFEDEDNYYKKKELNDDYEGIEDSENSDESKSEEEIANSTQIEIMMTKMERMKTKIIIIN